ncbi:cytochrome c oxidase assembly protein COX20, mitochondrial [Aethina tumida]|uniref:cytochrome c oxidase assembly protein COX20, mitochondrial n=1 Tax=Aethina tumida TaxID=116153 RepID=UPI00096B168F|nr:cytochrome c oxidase assembly protein COX20, mitochondrial [Aethina tumida]
MPEEEERRLPEVNPEPEKSFIIFGRDISKIPCFRNSLLYGMGGGITLGLGHFMFNSRPLSACNFAVYSFSFITLAYWIQCRYQYSVNKFEMLKMQELIRQNALYEGTERDNRPVDV